MQLDQETCYRALTARDVRFDGVFFVGVTTTGIYCRPVCTARCPGKDRCRFFANAAMAEKEGFRPCLRCRPELSPGLAPVDSVRTVAHRAANLIESGALNDGGSMESLALELGLSSRQLRRAVGQEFGVTPVELAQTKRLLLAKQLLTETRLPVVRVAFASGFESVRRFNDLFRRHYGLTPSTMRRSTSAPTRADCLQLMLGYRPPLAWRRLLSFLAARSTAGVEYADENSYQRTVAVGEHNGWLRVEPVPGRNLLRVELATSLVPVLPQVLSRLKGLFDLDARPEIIAEGLQTDSTIASLVRAMPGVRVPGAIDGFELAVRAMLGQRISVRAATSLAGRLANAFGEKIDTPLENLNRLFPSAEQLASTREASLVKIGISSRVAVAIRLLARAIERRDISLSPGSEPESMVAAITEISGIGPWTAQYIAMRALRWPDAFPDGDLALCKASGAASKVELRKMSERWRPWRAYATMFLWESLHRKIEEVQSA